MLAKLLANMIPRTCLICEQSTAHSEICLDCESSLPWSHQACSRCGRPLEKASRQLCETCLIKPPLFHRLHKVFWYQAPIIQLLQQFKFKEHFGFGQLMANYLCESVPAWYKKSKLPEAIVPVPMHFQRYQERGFNQLNELLKGIQQAPHLPPVIEACTRQRATRFQNKLSLSARERNLKQAFCLRKPMSYQHVAIFDDIITTGTTVNALAQLLLKAGVKRVDVWCIARV